MTDGKYLGAFDDARVHAVRVIGGDAEGVAGDVDGIPGVSRPTAGRRFKARCRYPASAVATWDGARGAALACADQFAVGEPFEASGDHRAGQSCVDGALGMQWRLVELEFGDLLRSAQ